MTTLTIEFLYNGHYRVLTACFKKDMTLSTAQANQATDIIDDPENYDDEATRWGVYFEEPFGEGVDVEAILFRDIDTGEMWAEVDYLIIWGGFRKESIIEEIGSDDITQRRRTR